MRPGNFNRTRAKVGVRVGIGDNRDRAAQRLRPDWDFTKAPNKRGIAGILRMHRNRTIAEHRLGPRCRDRDIIALLAVQNPPLSVALHKLIAQAIDKRVLKVPHLPRHFLVLHLKVRDGRA